MTLTFGVLRQGKMWKNNCQQSEFANFLTKSLSKNEWKKKFGQSLTKQLLPSPDSTVPFHDLFGSIR
jgi:hypothetical protein